MLIINQLILIMNLSTTFASLRKQVAGLSLVALVAGLFATGVATAATSKVFSDVPADAWYADYVTKLADAGVIDSTKDMYRPGDLVNRAEMAKFAFMVSGLPMEKASSAPYSDVAMGQWYTDYVYTLTKNGVVSGDKVNGVPTGKFRPMDSLNRAEATKMLVNAAQMAEDLSGAPHFPDVKSSDWFFNFVETAFNNGLVAGYPDGNFRPANNINRAEAAKMVYLAMNPVAMGFSLDSAAAASSTKVELIFSMNVDKASAETVANYAIEDSTGTKLNVTAATMMADDTVHLTTAAQTEGKVYYVTAKNVKSDAGDDLANNDSVSFLGYGSDVSGGDLTVALSTETPVAGSVPQGATGIVFTCWDFKAGSSAAMVKSLHVRRVGPGSQSAFENVYLYRGDTRLTTGRTINSETQTVEFNNINQAVAAGENAKMCIVADLTTTSNGGVHAFEVEAAADVMSNSSNMTGSFPLRGADQLITTGIVGKTKISKNGSLDEVTISQKGARIAQFELEADGQEDQMLNRIALYVRGTVNVNEVVNLKLFVEGDATELASATEVGAKDLATFALSKPYKIGRGQRKVFYVTADLNPGRDKDTIKTYLDETTDLYVEGSTFGYGTRVCNNNSGSCSSFPGSYDGASTNFSEVTIKGSTFNVAFTGPSSGDVSTGQKAARCLDVTITNGSGESVEVKDWPVRLAIQNAATAGGGLVDTTGTATANYTLVKLARVNADGSLGGTLLGPVELDTAGSDTTQDRTLSGSASIAAGESLKAAVVFDVRSSNAAMSNDKVRCSLGSNSALGLAQGGDIIRDVNGDALDSTSITPASPIVGNIFTVTQGALTVALSATPSTQTYTRGTQNAALAGLSFTASSSLDQTIKSLTVTGQVDGDPITGFSAVGSGTDAGVILSNVIDANVALYDGATKVSDFKNINTSTGKIVFNNLNINVAKSTTKNLVLKGNVSNSAPFVNTSNRVKFSVQAGTDVIAIDQNGQNVDTAAINTAGATNAADSVVMTITAAGNGTVATSTTASPTAIAGTNEIEVGKWTFTSVNETPMLKDLDFLVSNDSPASVANVKLYKGAACSTQVGSVSGYTPKPNGVVEVRDVNEMISSASTYTLCAKVTTSVVNSDGVSEPTSGSNVGLVMLSVSEVSSGSGENVAQRYAGAVTAGGILNTAMSAVATNANIIGHALLVGDVIQVEGEMMLVTTVVDANNVTVVRGFAATVASAHNLSSEVRLSTVAVRVTGAADVKAGDVYWDASAAGYCLALADSGTSLEDLDQLTPVTCGAPVANDTRFKLHGPLSRLYRSVPQFVGLSNAPSMGVEAEVLRFNVTAKGDEVRFKNNAGGASLSVGTMGAVAANASNQIVVKLTANGATTPAACKLVNFTDSKDLASIATVDPDANAGVAFVAFRFDTEDLTIGADSTKELRVLCNSITMLSDTVTQNLSAQLISDDKTVEWSDTVAADVLAAGKFIITNSMNGLSVTINR